ncbi:MAG: single-stranded-DNA-specific exonuclease RecJ [Clostridiales bacterium]|nr:single-stranded-DNA-specific exonuclease RecJ [Clostridiales bacterium]
MLRFIPRDTAPFDELAAAALRPYSGITAKLLHSRGITTAPDADAFMHPSLSGLHDPMLMSGMPEAAAILSRAREDNIPCVVYGDYDVDGVSACTILTQALRRYGIDAAPHIPKRDEGYGLNVDAIKSLAKTYKLLVTVDLGITNHEEVRLAQSLGMTVIVTDHHGLGLDPSPADAVINPLLGSYPYRKLCGAGVAFKVATVLLGLDQCMEYLDLVALATVADIVPLTGENRVLVSYGLRRIQSRERLGLRALLHVSGDPDPIDSGALGFRLGPRINAAGRLDDANKAVRLMMTDDPAEANALAQELDELNTARKTTESNLLKEASEKAALHDFTKHRALIIKGDSWHVGVIGLAAGKLCQNYFCPVCVLSEEDGMLHGSLRSIPGVNIHKCLQSCDDLLLRYGGHDQAAGVTLASENYDAFYERLQTAIAAYDPQLFVPAQEYDAQVSLADCTDSLLDELLLMEPFGCDNPAPLFYATNLLPEEKRAVGADGSHLKLTLRQDRCVMDGIAFSMGKMASNMPDALDGIFALGRNTFRGRTTLQLEVKALRPVYQAQIEMLKRTAPLEEQSELLDGFLDAFELQAGKTVLDTEVLLMVKTWADLALQLAAHDRGVLVISRTRASAAAALKQCEMDICRHAPSDARGFHTLLLAPIPSLIKGHWRQIWLIDGEIFEGESALWQQLCPESTIFSLANSNAVSNVATDLDAGDAAYRTLYKALRAASYRSLHQVAQASGLTASQVRCGMHAFRQLGLINFTESPFAYTLSPPIKCSLGDSPLLHALRALQHLPEITD